MLSWKAFVVSSITVLSPYKNEALSKSTGADSGYQIGNSKTFSVRLVQLATLNFRIISVDMSV